MANTTKSTLLVTGGSGHLARRVLTHLLETEGVPASQLIATTRNPHALSELVAAGVTVRHADFDDPRSLDQAFAGADRILLISTDSLDKPGHRLAQHQNAILAAERVGVGHVLYTSMPEPEGSPIVFAPDHLGTEKALSRSSLTWTLLRNSWYFENVFLSLPSALATGKWFTAAGDGRIAYLAREDVARAAAAALASNEAKNGVFTLTGHEALTIREVAEAISDTVGKPMQVIDVSVDDLTQGMIAAGVPAGFAEVIASFDVNTKEGRIANITSDYQTLTGRTPQSFSDWLIANRESISIAG